ncbi:MAG TPA: insulinase family protein [Roseiflexaceae bacterium]|nr:insulinase family protein [Roseiflexaceae bacterium]
MTILHGFELLREQAIRELNSTARLYRHVKTGAELLSLVNEDENKVFGITFRTPPSDSTGVAHILEHSVLCGSRKYPIKEPFVELMKGSLNTFLNAMTFPDKTCYPVASQNLQDFYNLIDVYLDAVFFPRITPQVLEQEGWHYELEAVDQPLAYKGVVFNEMKGTYSSPDSVLYEQSQQSLFPDNTYGLDSGGNPKHIPDLTYEQFRSFHERFYHPSNARIFFYGDDDPDERLRILDAYLSEFEPVAVESAVTLQSRFDQPKRLSRTYAGGQDAGDAKQAMLTVNWMIGEVSDIETDLGLGILSYILLGTSASPLRKALIDSGLGEDVTGAGLVDSLRQMMFSTGLKGIDAGDADAIESLILTTLRTLARDGIDPQTVEAALNTVEFSLRENNTGSFPRGISVMLRALNTWLYERDPLAPLMVDAPLGAVKARVAAGERYFEDLIGRFLLGNPHRTTLVLQPDPEQAAREADEERVRLARARAAMSEADLQIVVEATSALKLAQQTPDSPEALATIPMLTLDDLERRNKLIPLAVTESQGARVLYHDLFTNGIIYLDVGLDLHTLPADMLPYVGLFGRALLETGVGEQDFVQLSQRIGRATGGIWPQTFTSVIRGSLHGAAWLFLRGKAMPDKADELLAILRDVLMEARLDNQERFRQMVLEDKASQEARLIPGGHSVVNMRLRANFNEADWAAEQIGGVSYLFFLRALAQQIETDWASVQATLEQIRQTLLNRAAMLVNVTADAATWGHFEPQLADFLRGLPIAPVAPARWVAEQGPRFEGLTIPAQVNYVGKGADLYKLGYKPSGAASVIAKYLRTTWLWEKIRVQGGAYGGFCLFDHRSGGFTYLSYRDPNLLASLDVYDETAKFLRESELSQDELTKSIIGTIGEVDAYQLPDAKGFSSMLRYLVGDTDEIRQRMREEILATSAADFQVFADALEQVADRGLVVVLGSQAAIDAANAERSGWLDVSKVL